MRPGAIIAIALLASIRAFDRQNANIHSFFPGNRIDHDMPTSISRCLMHNRSEDLEANLSHHAIDLLL
jgi:hypothetical protein